MYTGTFYLSYTSVSIVHDTFKQIAGTCTEVQRSLSIWDPAYMGVETLNFSHRPTVMSRFISWAWGRVNFVIEAMFDWTV